MADPGELDVSCLDCHHNATMPVAALLPRYAAKTPFPEVWVMIPTEVGHGFRFEAGHCSGMKPASIPD